MVFGLQGALGNRRAFHCEKESFDPAYCAGQALFFRKACPAKFFGGVA